MPAYPSPEELEYVSAVAASLALERAANAGEPLDLLVMSWFPDHDAIDRRKVARDISKGLEQHRRLVLQRVERLEQQGKARCPGGQVQHHS